MKIENQEELEKLFKLMRKTGVESLKTPEIEIKLASHGPPKSKYLQKKADDALPDSKKLSDEELLFWSSTPPGLDEPKES